MDRQAWRVTASSYVVDTPHLRLRKDSIELPGGTQIDDYFVRESRGFVIVFAMLEDERVLLVRQYKHGIAREVLELPAGAIDPGELAQACAARELAEETGYAAESMQALASFVTDPTHSTTVAHLFLARGARLVQAQQLDVTEDICVEYATLADLRRYVRDGTIDCMPHVAAIYYVLDRLGR